MTNKNINTNQFASNDKEKTVKQNEYFKMNFKYFQNSRIQNTGYISNKFQNKYFKMNFKYLQNSRIQNTGN